MALLPRSDVLLSSANDMEYVDELEYTDEQVRMYECPTCRRAIETRPTFCPVLRTISDGLIFRDREGQTVLDRPVDDAGNFLYFDLFF